MIKKILTPVLFLFISNAFAQPYSVQNLVGRWEKYVKGYGPVQLQFLDDETAASVNPDGMVYTYLKYTYELKDGDIKLKYTTEINRKSNPKYIKADVRLLNDSVMLWKFDGAIPANADTSTPKVSVYRRVKIKPGNEVRFANYTDLKGKWVDVVKKKVQRAGLFFIDEDHLVFEHDGKADVVTYKADFTKQPIPLDFFLIDGRIKQSLISFKNKDMLWVEWFPNNNRGDHFRTLGYNIVLTRQK